MKDIIGSALVELKSVGSLLDIDCGLIYPQLEDGSPDWGCEISLYDDEVSSEWLDSLSDVDYELVKPYIQ